ncbi:hypothetical protein GCM10027414_04690 [Humibacter ginsengiterrae]
MPRLTNQDYLTTRSELHAAWTNSPTSIYLLTAAEQWSLHEYFRFVENLSPAVSLEYRQEITEEQPSLPQRAGHAVKQWRLNNSSLTPIALSTLFHAPGKGGAPHNIRLFAEVQPVLDPKRIAIALMAGFDDYQAAMARGEITKTRRR